MKFKIFTLSLLTLLACSPSNDSGDTTEQRINLVLFSLGMTHNSHLNRPATTPETSFSATVNFEVFLSEITNHEDLYALRIEDEEGIGWSFDQEEIRDSFFEDFNSLRFRGLELRRFDFISGKLLTAKILDEEGNIIFERGFSLSNSFPLPATTNPEFVNNSQLQLAFTFFDTPYDGGNIPFSITVYNTMFSSNTFSIVFLDSQGNELDIDNYGINNFDQESETLWTLNIDSDSFPENATSFYTLFFRGSFTQGSILFTEIDDLPANQ